MNYTETATEIFFEFEAQGQRVKVPIEFLSRHNIGGRDDLLARALGKKSNINLRVLDLTAGLGRDAFHMAGIGCNVTALERNATLAAALQKAWERSGNRDALRFMPAEAHDFLKMIEVGPEVIFYDPMFPEKKKSALPGKESQLLQLLATPDEDARENQILTLALEKAKLRVVVKRPLTAPPILRKPDVVFGGKSIRYDVYIKT